MSTIDRYAQDAHVWRISAMVDYRASHLLFKTEDLMLVFPAAALAHLAIEKYLKTALICTGATICDPRKYKSLIEAKKLEKDECAWGHSLLPLALKLAIRRKDFDLNLVLFERYPLQDARMTLRNGLEMFEPFFEELRYPREMTKFTSLGPSDVEAFEAIIVALEKFVW